MSAKDPKGGKKCTNFEPQLFRRSLCKNCFRTEAEHRNGDAATKSPNVKRKEAAEAPVEKTAIVGNKDGGKCNENNTKTKETRKIKSSERKMEIMEVKEQRSKLKLSEDSGSRTETKSQVKDDIGVKTLTRADNKGSAAAAEEDTATKRPTDGRISNSKGSTAGTMTLQAGEDRTKNIQAGGGENDSEKETQQSRAANENVTHSTGISQRSQCHIPETCTAGEQVVHQTPTAQQQQQQDSTGRTASGSTTASTRTRPTPVVHSVVVLPSSSCGTSGSANPSIGQSSQPESDFQYTALETPPSNERSGSGPDIVGEPSASYTAGIHYLENRNAEIREAVVQLGGQETPISGPADTGTEAASIRNVLSSNSGEQLLYGNNSKETSIQVRSGRLSPGVEPTIQVCSQGQGIQAGVDGNVERSIDQTTGQCPAAGVQIIPIRYADQSGSLAGSGTGSSPVSQSSGKTRTRRTRGNSDHLVQDPSTITIHYPPSGEISGESGSKFGITDIDSGSTEKQAELIIIPSEHSANKSVTSQIEPSLQHTQHVAYHKPVNDQPIYDNVTSSPSGSKTLSSDTLQAISRSSLYFYPESEQANQRQQQIVYKSTKSGVGSDHDWYYNSNVIPTRSQTDDDVTATGTGNKGTYFVRRRRKRPSVDESAWQAARQRRMADASDMTMARDEAMMEGTRMLIDSLREKIVILEARTEKIEREKEALSNLLSSKKEEYVNMEDDLKFRIEELEDQVNRLTNEKIRLLDRLKLPESERGSLRVQETEINELQKKMEEANQRYAELLEENAQLKQECRDLQLEMEEMHDQFREDEALEFREIQKELEATAKNCRILQFKLRKAERRNDQIEADRIHYEEKIRQLEAHFDDKQHIREMEEELKMAKEVSVRLHDELEFVEEKRQRYEEELDRMNDILTESESRRHALQKEIDSLTTEMAKLREELRRSNAVGPIGEVKKGQFKEGDYDLAQLMRDLSDSLERENDLKEQLKFAEEETRVMRKKLSDMEDENESLNLQLQKLSSAKSGKFLRKKDPGEKEVVTEREHELRLEMELAEQEIKVLRRKLDDLEEDNELLMKQIKEIQRLIEGSGKRDRDDEDNDDRPYDEKIRQMAKDIEVLKLKLIAKDQEAASKLRSSSSVRGMLKKSRSLEEYRETSPSISPVREFQQDIKRQLDFVQQEAGVLKEKLVHLEKENERLTTENRKLELMASRSGAPTISIDDAVLENIDLKERLTRVNNENAELREQIRLLDERTNRLSREVLQTKSTPDVWDETSESRKLRNQLLSVQDECKSLHKKVKELQSQNAKLTRDVTSRKGDTKKSKDFRNLDKLSSDELKERVCELENEVKNLLSVIKNSEDETERLEEEIDGYRTDIDKMLEAFRTREKELVDEIDNIQQRNEVLSNLLELVTERADSTGKLIEKYQKEIVSRAGAEAGTGSDDVKDAKGTTEQQEKCDARIESLEATLQEERLKLQATEKKLSLKDSPMTSVADDSKLREREKEILQQELALCQKQLKSANEQIRSLKDRLSKEQEAYQCFKEENEKLAKQLETEKKKADIAADTKKPASWRWEKQELEKQIKELKKKSDEMHEELKRQQFKWKLAGDDLARENKLKEKLEKQVKNIKEECDDVKKELEETKAKLDEVTKTLEKKGKQWEKERGTLESDKQAAEEDAKEKAEVIKSKDDIIKNKNKLIEEKDKSLKERNKVMKKNEELLKQKETELQMKNNSIKHKEDELRELRKKYEALELSMAEKEETIKKLNEDIRRRDDRLREKDEILEKINRKLVEKQNEVSDMDKTIREAMIKLDERESELKKLKAQAENTNKDMKSLEDKIRELHSELDKQKQEYEKKLSTITKQKEKVESEMNTLQKEKKALLNDLQDAKEKLNKEQEKWRREKNRLELDLNQKTEKLRSLDANRGLKQSEVVKNLSSEKEKLITEKHKLADDINRLKKELKDNLRQWNAEREDLQKIIAEKTKMIEDNNAITERMQKDIDALKKGQVSPSNGQKIVPIPVTHEVSAHRIPVITKSQEESKMQTELKAKLEEQEILMEADKEGLKELYEGRLANLTEELAVAHDKVSCLREENDKQLELLQSSRKALAELRNRYDQGVSSWNMEREALEKKAKDAEERKIKLNELQKTLDDIQEKLKLAERKAQESEKRLSTEKKVWAAEKASIQNKLKQYEDTSSAGGTVSTVRRDSKVSEFRAKFDKFEKFGGMQSSGTGLKKTVGSAGDVKNADVERTVKEAQKAIKDLQTLMKDLEQSRESDKKDLLNKLERERKEWEKEKNELKQQTVKLEAKSRELNAQEKLLVELQCKLQDERASWQTEKKQLQETLDATREIQLKEKAKVTELLAEIKRLQTLTKTIQDKEADSSLETKVRGTRRSRTPSEERPTFTTVKVIGSEEPEEVKRALDKSLCEIVTKALEHISKLAEELKVPIPVSERKKKALAPSVFRRSLSTSEVEVVPDRECFVHSAQSEFLLLPSHTIPVTTQPPSIVNSSSLDRPARSRRPRRGLSPEDSKLESDLVDRRSFRWASSNRNSMYASGTQSAYTSRDSSPEKAKKRSPYPAAPPSMIITPSHTPRRAPSSERDGRSLTSRDMATLYAKLSSIESGAQDGERKALVERGRGIRMLTKSTSVDHADEAPRKLNVGYSYARAADWSAPDGYDDAAKSETLMASIRLGELVITPGVEKLTKAYREQNEKDKHSESVSPRSARRMFYENYPYEPKEVDRWTSRLRTRDTNSDSSDVDADVGCRKSAEQKRRSLSRGKSIDTELDYGALAAVEPEVDVGRSRKDKYSLRSRAANFIQSVKDKRRMFAKRSSSVDTSVRLSIAQSGFQAATAGAPTSFDPPTRPTKDSKQSKPAKEGKEGKYKAFHRRASSIDLTTIFSVTRSSSVKDRDKIKASSSAESTSQTHSLTSSASSKNGRLSEETGSNTKKSTPALSAKNKPQKKSLYDGKQSRQTVKPVSCQSIPHLDDRELIYFVPSSDTSAVLRSPSFRCATSECPLVVKEESITLFNTWNFDETPV